MINAEAEGRIRAFKEAQLGLLNWSVDYHLSDSPTFKLWAAQALHQLTAMDYTQHHAAGKYNLILPQLAQQDQLQCDTRRKKAPLWPSTPAPC